MEQLIDMLLCPRCGVSKVSSKGAPKPCHCSPGFAWLIRYWEQRDAERLADLAQFRRTLRLGCHRVAA